MFYFETYFENHKVTPGYFSRGLIGGYNSECLCAVPSASGLESSSLECLNIITGTSERQNWLNVPVVIYQNETMREEEETEDVKQSHQVKSDLLDFYILP